MSTHPPTWRCWTHEEGQEALDRAYDRYSVYAREAFLARELDPKEHEREEHQEEPNEAQEDECEDNS